MLDRFKIRFKKKFAIGPRDECWPWIAGCGANGYGEIGIGGRKEGKIAAHRAAWLLAYGPFPKTMHVLHKCDNHRCVNPDHLFLGTHQDNMADMLKKGRERRGLGWSARTHCSRGHPYDATNTYRLPGKTTRICKICHRQSERKCRAKKTQSVPAFAPIESNTSTEPPGISSIYKSFVI